MKYNYCTVIVFQCSGANMTEHPCCRQKLLDIGSVQKLLILYHFINLIFCKLTKLCNIHYVTFNIAA